MYGLVTVFVVFLVWFTFFGGNYNYYCEDILYGSDYENDLSIYNTTETKYHIDSTLEFAEQIKHEENVTWYIADEGVYAKEIIPGYQVNNTVYFIVDQEGCGIKTYNNPVDYYPDFAEESEINKTEYRCEIPFTEVEKFRDIVLKYYYTDDFVFVHRFITDFGDIEISEEINNTKLVEQDFEYPSFFIDEIWVLNPDSEYAYDLLNELNKQMQEHECKKIMKV